MAVAFALSRRRLHGLLGAAFLSAYPVSAAASGSGASPGRIRRSFSTTLPAEFGETRRPTTPVDVEGHGPFDFLVSTATSTTMFCEETAVAIGLLSAASRSKRVTARTLQVGSAEVSNVELLCRPQSALGAVGVLGLDVFGTRRVFFDFAGGEIRLGHSAPRSGPIATNFTVVGGSSITSTTPNAAYMSMTDVSDIAPAIGHRRAGGVLAFECYVGTTHAYAVIDTGSELSVGNGRLLSSLNTGDGTAMPGVEIEEMDGTVRPGRLGKIDTLRFPGFTMGSAPIVWSELRSFYDLGLSTRPALIIGMDILSRFDWCEIDYRGREARFGLPT